MTRTDPQHGKNIEPAANLTARTGVPGDRAVLAPLTAYALGHATGDPTHFERAFRQTAHIEGIRDGVFVSWNLPQYQALFSGSPAIDEAKRTRVITLLQVRGSIAVAEIELAHGPDSFTDQFLLVHHDGEWRIANKVYDRRTINSSPAPTADQQRHAADPLT